MDFEKAMTEKGFRYEYIKKIKQCCAKIIVAARMVAWDSFEDIRTYYKNSDLSKTSRQCYLLAINKMEDFLNGEKVSCHRNAPHCIEDATPSLGTLNLLELKDRLIELQQYMEDNQYTAPYIRKVILKAEKIIVLSGKVTWNSYQDILDWYRDQGYDEKYIRDIVQISFLLGQASVETTMIYLDITTEKEYEALTTLENEKQRKVKPKWNKETDTLSDICGLHRLKT